MPDGFSATQEKAFNKKELVLKNAKEKAKGSPDISDLYNLMVTILEAIVDKK